MKLWKLTALLFFAVVGCTDNPFDSADSSNTAIVPTGESKLRHAQLVSASSVAGKGAEEGAQHVFIGFREYEDDGTPREIDSYGVTRRVLNEYGVKRRVLEEYGVKRRVLEEYGISSGVLNSYSLVLDEVGPLGVPEHELVAVDYDITADFLLAMGIDAKEREERGITDQVLEEYGVTRRVLQEYGVSVAEYLEAIAVWERTIRLKTRIDSARPGMFVSLGTLSLDDFVNEASTDEDIELIEIDVEIEGQTMGSVTESAGRYELTPWGITDIGGGQGGSGTTHVFLVDSGVEHEDLNIVERADFSDVYRERDGALWDDTNAIERTVASLLDTTTGLLDFLTNDTQAPDDKGVDVTGHGTHLAGIIGAQQNDKLVVGAAPGVAIHSLRVMNDRGQSDIATVVAALDYISYVKTRHPEWAMVVNMSLGMNLGSTSYNVLDEAVQKLTRMGITVVVAAGNDGVDASTYSPAHVAEAITVGAYNQSRKFSSFSNWGRTVDILAPGELIASVSYLKADVDRNVALVESGTSQAAAHVTGIVAHYLTQNKLARPEEVKAALLRDARSGIGKLPANTTDRSVYLDTSKSDDSLADDGGLLGGLLGGGRKGRR